MEKYKRGNTIYIISKIVASWDGCSGYESDEYFTNWIFSNKDTAMDKCNELNNKYGRYGCGSSLKFKVNEDYIID